MNKTKLFKVTIEDENGKVIHEVMSDCFIAAISNPSQSTEGKINIIGSSMTNCSGKTAVSAFKVLDKLKRDAIKRMPMLGLALSTEMLSELMDKLGESVSDDTEDVDIVGEQHAAERV